jgi:hypothetical protein
MEGQYQRRFHDMKDTVLSTLDMISTTCTLYIIYLIVTVSPSDLQFLQEHLICVCSSSFQLLLHVIVDDGRR